MRSSLWFGRHPLAEVRQHPKRLVLLPALLVVLSACGAEDRSAFDTDASAQLAAATAPPPGCPLAHTNQECPPSTESVALGWVWADQPNLTDYAPHSDYQFNSTGAANYIQRVATGRYEVGFPGLGGVLGGVVLVTPNDRSHRCVVERWGTVRNTLKASVRCFATSGVAADGQFTALYLRTQPESAFGGAYLWANRFAPSTPSATYSWNSLRTPMSVDRVKRQNQKWDYLVNFGDSRFAGTPVFVTPYGGRAPRYCWVESVAWTGVAKVGCDEKWTLYPAQFVAVALTNEILPELGTSGIVLSFPRPIDTTGCTFWFPVPVAPGIRLPEACRDSVGRYRIVLSGRSATRSTAQVTSRDDAQCAITGWHQVGPDAEVSVHCYDRDGRSQDGGFNLLYLTDPSRAQQPLGPSLRL